MIAPRCTSARTTTTSTLVEAADHSQTPAIAPITSRATPTTSSSGRRRNRGDVAAVSCGAGPPAGGTASADYWDNEGHVIRYAATWSADGKVLTLVSDGAGGGPRYRLVYGFPVPNRATVSFEVAPPGSDTFRKYVSGAMTKGAR